ncbi:MAG: cytochrome c [Gammaproteobacteria bacterium]|nr:cytochrome c [Gammaproteobacteria bacterium]MDH5729975.1 cytochrome c [Gammaproteobacteria bacterium]
MDRKALVLRIGVLLMTSLFLGSANAAGDAKAGQAKSLVCGGCHGSNGISFDPNIPNLKGQKDKYIVTSLQRFKSGERKSEQMTAVTAAMSQQDMEDLAAYFSKLK